MRYHRDRCRDEKRTAFCLLEPSTWNSFINIGTRHQLGAGQIVFREGMPALTTYILCRGRVVLSFATPRRTLRPFMLLSAHQQPCKILDTPSLGMAHHSVTCKALTDTQIACLDKTRFIQLIRDDHQFSLLVLQALVTDLASYHDALRNSFGTARQHMAKLLLTLSSQGGAHESSDRTSSDLHFSLRRQDIAELHGMARETASRLLNSFQRENLITINGQTITLRSVERLRQLAGDSKNRVTIAL